MTPEEGEKMNDLCQKIMEEKDPKKFGELVKALNDLLDAKYERIHSECEKDPN